LLVPWLSHAGQGHDGRYGRHGHHGNARISISANFWHGRPSYCRPPFWRPRCVYGPPVYYCPPPIIIHRPSVYIQTQEVYVQRGSDDGYWYYCDNPQGFYPYIKSCPGGWMKVVPETVPPNR
jgi:hypothetical protein